MTEKGEKPKLELVDQVPSIFDDLAKLRKESVITVKRKAIKGAITVGKPKNNIYFQSHQTVFLEDVNLVVGPEGSDDFYFVAPAMKTYWALAKRLRQVTIAVVYSWPGGAISLWPVNQVDDTCRVKCWKTAQLAFERSKTEWVQMIWNDVESDYDLTPAEEIKVVPLWPEDLNLTNLMKIGFAGARTIETAEHPYVKQLRGLDT